VKHTKTIRVEWVGDHSGLGLM